MEAMRGMGVDRHLFGLYVMAKGLKMDPMPKMFTDKVQRNLSMMDTVGPHKMPLEVFLYCRGEIIQLGSEWCP